MLKNMDKVSQAPSTRQFLICDQGGTGFSRKKQLTTHQRIHQGKEIHKCQYCCTYFLHKSHLRDHEISHTGERLNKCDQCGEGFRTSSDLSLHKLLHSLQKQNTCHTGHKKYTCDQCGAVFVNSYHLRIHLQKHNGKRTYMCQYCGKFCLYIYHLKVHERSHTKERPFRCGQCGKVFLAGCHLNLHKRVYCLKKHKGNHTRRKTFKCEQCGAVLAQSYKLKIHRQIHKRQEIHKCRYCGKCCLFISELKKHEIFHTKEQPYRCDQCGVSFTVEALFKQHQSMCCLKKTEKLCIKVEPYNSDQRGKVLTNQGSLPRHEGLHIERKSNEPNNGKILIIDLKKHVAKLFECEKCGDVFTKLEGLRRHWKLHAGTNGPYTHTCVQCGKVYKRLWALQKHKKLHNAVKSNTENSNLIECKDETYSNKSEDENVLKQTRIQERHLELHTEERPHISSPNFIPKEEPYDFDVSLTEGKDTNATGKQTDGKFYTRDQCGKVFTGQGDLQRHLERHTGERPNIFSPNFTLKEEPYDFDVTLTEGKDTSAIVKQTDGIPCPCDQCGKVFRGQGDLQRHWAFHNTERANISNPNSVIKQETHDSDKDENAIAKESEKFLCKDCGMVVKIQCTNVANVFSLTNSLNVKCFIEKHTLTPL